MSRLRTLWTALLGLTLIAVLGACGADGSAPDGPTVPVGQPVSGGAYVHALEADPNGCLDGTQQRYHVAFNIIRQITDSLVDLDPVSGQIVPWLAQSWQISPDAQEFTFKLQDGVTFSNGEVFDAAAVKGNFDRVIELGPAAIGAYPILTGYDRTEVVDPLTVKVVFSEPNIQFLQGLTAAWLGFISPSDLAKEPAAICAGDYSGTGPFQLDHYTKNDEAVLVRRAGYDWPSAAYQHTGEAYLDRLVFKFLSESGVRAGAVQTGQAHSISLVAAQDESAIVASGAELFVTQPPGMELVWIANQQSTYGGDPVVRRAIALALDRAELLTLYGSGFEIASGLLGPATMPYYVDQSDLIQFDPDQARTVLEEAGWAEGADGIRQRDGQRLTIRVIVALTEQYELLQAQLKRVGVEFLIEALDTASQAAATDAGDYDFYVWNMTRADPDVIKAIFISGLDGKGQNRSWALPSPADQYLAAQGGAADPAQRQADVKAAVDYLVEQNLAIPELTRAWVYAVAPTVQGFAVDGESKLVFYDTWLTD
ncbi:MAG: ABC transporter substrate-binding protein [Propionibacteriaceae bacterium]|jgi:peptide/nickel transport system substrate-binding protein|nr:ABC transporter substrate-binding protein [Propionibacteriaceae bacterium]